MLVATALVVVMLLMFAQIYTVAVSGITNQRGLANNDQKARMFATIIRNDLQNLTYRQPSPAYGNVQGIVPLAPGDEAITDPLRQKGYLYYSENNPLLDFDDVLQFTVMLGTPESASGSTQQLFQGAAANLGLANEPDLDDGVSGNGLGSSRAAEIAYFLRAGNLYRRVLPLRDPVRANASPSNQPGNGVNDSYNYNIGSQDYTNTSNFYTDFGYSATRAYAEVFNSGTGSLEWRSWLWFNGIDSLDNTAGESNSPLALPWHRFGFHTNPQDTNDHGMPREYDSSATPAFFGRYTEQETSYIIAPSVGDQTLPTNKFGWPGINNPYMDRSTGGIVLDADGVINSMDGIGVNEDLLLSNVEAMDVEIYDLVNETFVSIGDAGSLFADGGASRTNTVFGPSTGGNRVFDTWHPATGTFFSNTQPPTRPLIYTGAITSTFPTNPATTLTVGERYRVPALTTSAGNFSNSMHYEVIQSGPASARVPELPPVPGTIVTIPTSDTTIQPAILRCVDNRIGIPAIRITIRYRDIQSNQIRQVSIVHSFVE